jgi:hypothetical protein
VTDPYTDLDTIAAVGFEDIVPSTWFAAARDNFETLARSPGCVVRRTATQSIGNAGLDEIEYTAADDRDTDGFHSTSVNPTRMTVPAGLGGWYRFGGSATFASNSTGNRILQPRVNGSTSYEAITWTGVVASTFIYPDIPILLVPGDYVEMLCYQNSGGALNITAARAWLRLVDWP